MLTDMAVIWVWQNVCVSHTEINVNSSTFQVTAQLTISIIISPTKSPAVSVTMLAINKSTISLTKITANRPVTILVKSKVPSMALSILPQSHFVSYSAHNHHSSVRRIVHFCSNPTHHPGSSLFSATERNEQWTQQMTDVLVCIVSQKTAVNPTVVCQVHCSFTSVTYPSPVICWVHCLFFSVTLPIISHLSGTLLISFSYHTRHQSFVGFTAISKKRRPTWALISLTTMHDLPVSYSLDPNLVSLWALKSHFASIFHRLADQSVAAGEQECLLDDWGVIANDINHQLDVLWLSDIPGDG